MAGDEDARIVNAASLSKQLVDRVLAERARQVELIASAPSVDRGGREGRRDLAPNAACPTSRSGELEADVQGDALAAGGRRRASRS